MADNNIDDEYTRMTDQELIDDLGSLLREIERGEVHATPEELADLREKRAHFIRSVEAEKVALQRSAIANALAKAAPDNLLNASTTTDPTNRGH